MKTKYNFDKKVDRKNTGSLKHDAHRLRHKSENLMPFWVADMDFRLPKIVLNDLKKRVKHGVFGYAILDKDYFTQTISWFKRRYKFIFKENEIVVTPGAVFALNVAINAFTNIGDSILIQRPVYYPFTESIIFNDRKLVNNPLKIEGTSYEMDLVDFENKIKKNKIKLFILSSPHNPVGKVWEKETLKKVISICNKYKTIIISDEVHMDICFNKKHCILPSLVKDKENNIVLITSASKTFNMPGLQITNCIIKNPKLRKAFELSFSKTGYSNINPLAITTLKSVYKNGEAWLEELLVYLKGNYDFLVSYLAEKLPEVKVFPLEATYLVWIDFRKLKIKKENLSKKIEELGLWLDTGEMFGKEGLGFQRINIATSRSYLKTALDKLAKLKTT